MGRLGRLMLYNVAMAIEKKKLQSTHENETWDMRARTIQMIATITNNKKYHNLLWLFFLLIKSLSVFRTLVHVYFTKLSTYKSKSLVIRSHMCSAWMCYCVCRTAVHTSHIYWTLNVRRTNFKRLGFKWLNWYFGFHKNEMNKMNSRLSVNRRLMVILFT